MRRFFAHSISVARSPAGRNLYGAGSRVRDLAEHERLRRQDLPDRARARSGGAARAPPSGTSTRARRRPRARASRALSSPAALSVNVTARICVGRERARRDLLRDPARDRRRLAGARAREDADRPAHRLRGAPLLGVQAVERVHCPPEHRSGAPGGQSSQFGTSGQELPAVFVLTCASQPAPTANDTSASSDVEMTEARERLGRRRRAVELRAGRIDGEAGCGGAPRDGTRAEPRSDLRGRRTPRTWQWP